jgi:hypothetical protein
MYCLRNSLAELLPLFVIPTKAGIQVFLCIFPDSDFHVHLRARPNDTELC